MEDSTFLSAAQLAARTREGSLSAREVVEAHIRRIEAVNPRINAVVIPLFDEARAQAEEADQKRDRGEPLGALHGVPVTVKEQFRVAGTQTTLGAVDKVGNVYRDEGPLVSALRRAGAIVLGKTNIIQTLAGWECDNRVYGRTNNPWNLDRAPGGSSGGDGAAVSVGGAALALAGDFGGSIRIPAHFCGVHGLKPTSHRLTNDDFATGLLGYGQEAFIPQPGPIARSVADLELAMRVFAETSLSVTHDVVPPVPWRDPERLQVEGMRIGFYTDNGYFPASPAIRRVVDEAAAALQRRGASVAPFAPPDAGEAVRIFLGAASAGGTKDYRRLLGNEKPLPQVAGLFRQIPKLVAPIVEKLPAARGQRYLAAMLPQLGERSAEEYWKLVEARTDYLARFHDSLDEGGFDGVLCPPAALPALRHGSSEHLFPAISYAFTYNVLGAPAGVVAASRVRPGEESDRAVGRDMAEIVAQRVEQESAGLPVGVQVVAHHWREDTVLAVMAALEEHFREQPDYPARPPILG